MTKQELASHLDLANHHANSTTQDIIRLCQDVAGYGFNAAFVNPTYIHLAKKQLKGRAKVGTAFSFPLGQDTVEMKVFAAKQAIQLGADELDIVPNNGLLLTDELSLYSEELKAIVSAAKAARADIVVKFILETGYFIKDDSVSPEEYNKGKTRIQQAAREIAQAGATFVKICSGLGPRGASIEDVKMVREAVGTKVKIKAAGGINTLKKATSLLTAGADRIGTSSAVEIIEEFKSFHS